MAYASFDLQQQPWQNPQHLGLFPPQLGQAFGQAIGAAQTNGLGPAAYGGYGQFGPHNQAYWAGGMTAPSGWGFPQRQLSQQDMGDVVRQLVPLLPHLIAQAQQPQAAFAYAPYGQQARMLTPHDVNEVVRQILPIVPQIVGALQGQGQFYPGAFGQQGHPGLAAFGGYPLAPWAGSQMAQPFGQPYAFPAAFGGQGWGPTQQPRQLSQHDVGEVVRQLATIIPQVIGQLQANQTRMI